MLRAFIICWTALFAVLVLTRIATAVTFEVGYDELSLMGLAFGLGMLLVDFIKEHSR